MFIGLSPLSAFCEQSKGRDLAHSSWVALYSNHLMAHSFLDSRKHRETGNVALLLECFPGICKGRGLIPSRTDTEHGDIPVTPVFGK